MKYLSSAVFLLFVSAQNALAAGSNIALSEYPGPPCTKPQKPAEIAPPPDQKAVTASDNNANAAAAFYNMNVKKYNTEVAAYNAAVNAFNSCMKTYMENGNADMLRIKQRLDQAVADTNGP
jgi:hypothetical protein